MVRQQAQSRTQTEASAQEQVALLLAEKTTLESRLRSLEEGYLQARMREQQANEASQRSSPSHTAITPVMMAEGEFLRHVTARVQVGDDMVTSSCLLRLQTFTLVHYVDTQINVLISSIKPSVRALEGTVGAYTYLVFAFCLVCVRLCLT